MKGTIFAIALGVASILAVPAQAHFTNCGPRDAVVERLTGDQYSESVVKRGLNSNGQRFMEVWEGPDGGTWTVTLTNAQGLTCVIVSGTDIHDVLPVEEPEGDPT